MADRMRPLVCMTTRYDTTDRMLESRQDETDHHSAPEIRPVRQPVAGMMSR